MAFYIQLTQVCVDAELHDARAFPGGCAVTIHYQCWFTVMLLFIGSIVPLTLTQCQTGVMLALKYTFFASSFCF